MKQVFLNFNNLSDVVLACWSSNDLTDSVSIVVVPLPSSFWEFTVRFLTRERNIGFLLYENFSFLFTFDCLVTWYPPSVIQFLSISCFRDYLQSQVSLERVWIQSQFGHEFLLKCRISMCPKRLPSVMLPVWWFLNALIAASFITYMYNAERVSITTKGAVRQGVIALLIPRHASHCTFCNLLKQFVVAFFTTIPRNHTLMIGWYNQLIFSGFKVFTKVLWYIHFDSIAVGITLLMWLLQFSFWKMLTVFQLEL